MITVTYIDNNAKCYIASLNYMSADSESKYDTSIYEPSISV